jgi:uncharacterized protein YqeY
MELSKRISDDLASAMKRRATLEVSVLRMAKAALKNREIDKRAVLDQDDELRVLRSLVKQREEAAEQFRRGGRSELAEKEKAEIEILRHYLPEEASDQEIAAAVEQALEETGASSAKDLGRVMKAALAALKAKGKPVDGKRVNQEVRRRLGA